MTHEEANWRLNLTRHSGYSNSFSSGNEGKATRDDLYKKDWGGSSCGLVRLRLLFNCPSVPQGGGIIGRQIRVTFESKLTGEKLESEPQGFCWLRPHCDEGRVSRFTLETGQNFGGVKSWY